MLARWLGCVCKKYSSKFHALFLSCSASVSVVTEMKDLHRLFIANRLLSDNWLQYIDLHRLYTSVVMGE